MGDFGIDVAFAHHFHGPPPPPPSTPIRVLVILAMPVKNYQKWWAVQQAIHSKVGVQIDYDSSRIMANCVQDTIL